MDLLGRFFLIIWFVWPVLLLLAVLVWYSQRKRPQATLRRLHRKLKARS